MSASYHTYLMVGVTLDKLLKECQETAQVTKYNPDTGEPYQKKTTTLKWYWCGKECEEEPDDLESFVRKRLGKELSLHTTGGGSDGWGSVVVGITLRDLKPQRMAIVSIQETQRVVDTMCAILQGQGVDIIRNYPQIYCIHYAG